MGPPVRSASRLLPKFATSPRTQSQTYVIPDLITFDAPDDFVSGLLESVRTREYEVRRANFADRGVGTQFDLQFTTADKLAVVDAFMGGAQSANFLPYLGHLAAFLMTFQATLRGESTRFFEFSDLQAFEIENQGSSASKVVVFLLNNGKTVSHGGKVQATGVLRHKDPRLCSVSALALLFFARFMLLGEPFPKLDDRSEWFNIKVIRASDRSKTVKTSDRPLEVSTTYEAQLTAWKRAMKATSVHKSKVTHLGRYAGAIDASEATVNLDCELERHGKWARGSMKTTYLAECLRM